MSKFLSLAVRAFCALAESTADVTPATLFSWDRTKTALEGSTRGARVLAELNQLSEANRDRVLDLLQGFEPLSPLGETFIFPDPARAQKFAENAGTIYGGYVDQFTPEVVNVRNVDVRDLAEVAGKLGGIRWTNRLVESFSHVDIALPNDMVSLHLPMAIVEGALLQAVAKTFPMEEAALASNAPERRFAGRLARFVGSPVVQVAGVPGAVCEALLATKKIPSNLVGPLKALLREEAGTDTSGASATSGTPQNSTDSGISRDQPDVSNGSPARSQNGAKQEPKAPTEHVPAEEAGNANGITMPDGTPIPEEVLRDALAKLLQVLGTQIQQGVMSADAAPPPPPAEKKEEPPKEEKPPFEKKDDGAASNAPPKAPAKDEKPSAPAAQNESGALSPIEQMVLDAVPDTLGTAKNQGEQNAMIAGKLGTSVDAVGMHLRSLIVKNALVPNRNPKFSGAILAPPEVAMWGGRRVMEARQAPDLAEAARAFLAGKLDLKKFIAEQADGGTASVPKAEEPPLKKLTASDPQEPADNKADPLSKSGVAEDRDASVMQLIKRAKDLLRMFEEHVKVAPQDGGYLEAAAITLNKAWETWKAAQTSERLKFESIPQGLCVELMPVTAFAPASMRTVALAPGVLAGVGMLREGAQKARVQLLVFAKPFTESTARAWIAKNVPGPTPARREGLAESADAPPPAPAPAANQATVPAETSTASATAAPAPSPLHAELETMKADLSSKLAAIDTVQSVLKVTTPVAAAAKGAAAAVAAPPPPPAPPKAEDAAPPPESAPAVAPPANESLDPVGRALMKLVNTRVPARIRRGDHHRDLSEAVRAECPELDTWQIAEAIDRLTRVEQKAQERILRLELSEADRALVAEVSTKPGDAAANIVSRAAHGPTAVFESELRSVISSLQKFGDVKHRLLAEELAKGITTRASK